LRRTRIASPCFVAVRICAECYLTTCSIVLHILSSYHITYVNRPKYVNYVLFNWSIYTVSREERSEFWEVTVSVILSICPIPNGFRDTAISLYSSKIVDKKEILRAVATTGIYCSRDEVGTV
jgi:hypothetical protein